MKNNTYKKLSVPYRLLVSKLMPTYRREHPEQPVTGLPLTFIFINLPGVVKRNNIVRDNIVEGKRES